MLLYRARSATPRRRAVGDNSPATRAVGRWFTDDLEAAVRHLDVVQDPAEIVAIEIPDAVAESFRVSNTPFTQCGLSPIDHAADPEHDFLVPMFFALQGEAIERVAEEGVRQRDYILPKAA